MKNDFGKRLQEKRKDLGYSCEELADECFINSGYLRQLESGEIPGLMLLIKLCDILNTSPSYLLGFPEDLDEEEQILIEKIHGLTEKQQKVVLGLIETYVEYKNG